MHRLFVGLRPPPAIRTCLLALMGGVAGARWQDDDQLHCTLRFVGEVERPVAEDVALALGSVRHPRIISALNGVGSFERRGRVNALWAGLTPHAPLAQLHRKVDQALIRAGLAPEQRAYIPHITLARLGSTAGPTHQFIVDHAALASPPFEFTYFTLFESHLGHDGASYEAVERYPLD